MHIILLVSVEFTFTRGLEKQFSLELVGANTFWTQIRTRIVITLLIFLRNIFLCLHLVIALKNTNFFFSADPYRY